MWRITVASGINVASSSDTRHVSSPLPQGQSWIRRERRSMCRLNYSSRWNMCLPDFHARSLLPTLHRCRWHNFSTNSWRHGCDGNLSNAAFAQSAHGKMNGIFTAAGVHDTGGLWTHLHHSLWSCCRGRGWGMQLGTTCFPLSLLRTIRIYYYITL